MSAAMKQIEANTEAVRSATLRELEVRLRNLQLEGSIAWPSQGVAR